MFTTPRRSPTTSPNHSPPGFRIELPTTTPAGLSRPRADLSHVTPGYTPASRSLRNQEELSFDDEGETQEDITNTTTDTSGAYDSSYGQEEDEGERVAVDDLINGIQKKMRIVSTASDFPTSRQSEVEATEVENLIPPEHPFAIDDEDQVLSPEQDTNEPNVKGSTQPRATHKVIRSLGQPSIQPRMNRSTLARLNGNSSPRPNRDYKPSPPTHKMSVSNLASRPLDSPLRESFSRAGNQVPKESTVNIIQGQRKMGEGVAIPASIRPPSIVGKPTRSSTLRATMAKDPSYFSPEIDTKSISRTVDMSPLAIKERQARIFQGTPGHKRNLSLKNEISSLRQGATHRTNRSADLRRDPTLAARPVTPSREFKARPLPAMYGNRAGVRRGTPA